MNGARLERAFTEAPAELNDAVERAFLKGERAMKKRHKIMASLTAAAAFAVLALGIALAAGRLTAPRPDPVVTAQGGVAIAATGTPEPTPLPDELPEPTPEADALPEPTPLPSSETVYYFTENGRYYHTDPNCSGMRGAQPHTPELALASGKRPCPVCVENLESAVNESGEEASAVTRMSAQEAWEKLLEADPTAGKAGQVWLYLSSEAKAAWAFCANGENSDAAFRTGAAWFISEKQCVCLGRSDSVESWYFFTQQPQPNPVPPDGDEDYVSVGSYAACGRELFTSRIRKGNTTVAHLWMVGEDGLPIELDTGNGLTSVEVYGGILTGKRDVNDNDWVFLYAHDQLYQVTAQTADVDAVEALPGAASILNELQGAGYTITDCLYRSMDQLGSGAAAITVNMEEHGEPFHAYLFRRSYDAPFIVMTGWEDDINVYPGKGTLNPDAGLPTLASGTLRVEADLQKGRR